MILRVKGIDGLDMIQILIKKSFKNMKVMIKKEKGNFVKNR